MGGVSVATKLGQKLKNLRTCRGLSLDALADKAGLSKSYLWELENRESARPSAEKLQAIADIFEVEASYFLDDDVETPQPVHVDQAFFRNYQRLPETDKEQLRRILDTFNKKR